MMKMMMKRGEFGGMRVRECRRERERGRDGGRE